MSVTDRLIAKLWEDYLAASSEFFVVCSSTTSSFRDTVAVDLEGGSDGQVPVGMRRQHQKRRSTP